MILDFCLFRRPCDSVCFVSDVRNALFKLILFANIPVEYISQYENHRNLLVWLLAFAILFTVRHFEFVSRILSIPSPPVIFNQLRKRGCEIFTEWVGMDSQCGYTAKPVSPSSQFVIPL